MIKKELFGTLPEGEVYCYTLDNQKGLSAEIITKVLILPLGSPNNALFNRR